MKRFFISLFSSFTMNHYEPHEIKLANEIAATLNDWDAVPLYCKYARMYQEPFLREKLAKVMSIPSEKIKRSRGALFTFLIERDNGHGGARRHGSYPGRLTC
jgi:hypothetical protein